MPARVVVLVSGEGTNLQALIDASADPAYGVEVVAVGADRTGIAGLARAERAGIPTFVVRLPDCTARDCGRERVQVHDHELERLDVETVQLGLVGVEPQVGAELERLEPDLVVLAGYMKVLAGWLVERWRFVNTHPALLPAFPGATAVRDALAHGVKITGATVHLVVAEVDAGPIVAQAAVDVRADDDEASLHARIKAVEQRLLVDAVGRIARGGVRVEGRTVVLP
jgi:phosphoribosylglycinamide formyltransferase 1